MLTWHEQSPSRGILWDRQVACWLCKEAPHSPHHNTLPPDSHKKDGSESLSHGHDARGHTLRSVTKTGPVSSSIRAHTEPATPGAEEGTSPGDNEEDVQSERGTTTTGQDSRGRESRQPKTRQTSSSIRAHVQRATPGAEEVTLPKGKKGEGREGREGRGRPSTQKHNNKSK